MHHKGLPTTKVGICLKGAWTRASTYRSSFGCWASTNAESSYHPHPGRLQLRRARPWWPRNAAGSRCGDRGEGAVRSCGEAPMCSSNSIFMDA
jgi:hypothetical protein